MPNTCTWPVVTCQPDTKSPAEKMPVEVFSKPSFTTRLLVKETTTALLVKGGDANLIGRLARLVLSVNTV